MQVRLSCGFGAARPAFACRLLAWAAPAGALALACLPESADLAKHSSEWQPGSAGRAGAAQGGAGAGAPMGASGMAGAAAVSVGGSVAVGGSYLEPVFSAGGGGPADGGIDPSVAGDAGTPPVDPSPSDPCPDGVLAGASCYRLATVPLTWQQARAECEAWQGALVKVESAQEDQLVGSLVQASLWLGASDTVSDNVYAWTDGSPVLFGNWGPGQPDAFPGADCIEKRFEDGQLWFDQPCDNARLYVCEKVSLE